MSEDGPGARTDEWREALARFESLADLDGPELTAALATLREENPALHARIEELLEADRRAGSGFLATPSAPTIPTEAANLEGRAIGPYQLVREIGVGGMGRVWLARRVDGHYQGDVAIKLLRGALTAGTMRERFAREGRILGALAHPGIARLLDAGTLEDGQLYLVLEYVEGVRIDRHCKARNLSIRERVQLFLQACDAIAYAHANLVVHRDVKPSNILVTPAGEVKLLDFGIAKLLDEGEEAAEATELTKVGGGAYTPEYAAPEQVSGAQVTTATDVYSLGVVLYLMLSGESPYRLDEASRSSAFDLQRAVLEQEPRRLGAGLAGDLENIVAKALKKAPRERYASAQALGEDLRRYLDDLPVIARGDGAGYVMGKFVRRHRALVAAAGVVLLAVVAGAVGVAWQASIARQESARAQVQAARAKAVSNFMTGIFEANSAANPDPAKARATTARELLELGAQRAEKDLAGNPEVYQEVLLLLGRLYFEVGMGREGIHLDLARLETLRKLDAGTGPRIGEALAIVSSTYLTMGEPAKSLQYAREAIAYLEAGGLQSELSYARALTTLADGLRFENPAKALEAMRAAAEAFRKHHPNSEHYAFNLRALAVAHLERGEPKEAAEAIARAIAVGERSFGPEHADMALMHQMAGSAYTLLLQYERASESFLRGIAISQRAGGRGVDHGLFLEANLAPVMHHGPQWRSARERLERVGESPVANEPGRKRPRTFISNSLATIYLREGDIASARRAIEQTQGAFRQTISKSVLARIVSIEAEIEIVGRRTDKAEASLAELRALLAGPLAGNAVVAARVGELEARLQLDRRGEAALARDRAAALLASAPKRTDSPVLETASLRLLLSRAETESGRAAEGGRLAREVLAAIEARPDRAWFAEHEATALLCLGRALAAQGRASESRALLERAQAMRIERHHAASPLLAEARAALK